MSQLHQKLTGIRATLSLPLIETELDNLSAQIDVEKNAKRKEWLCAAYQALSWARSPDGYDAPSNHQESPSLLLIRKG